MADKLQNRSIEIRAEKRRTEIRYIIAETMIQLGLSSADLSYTACCRMYGDWFIDAVKHGRLLPSRVGKGNHGNRWYSVADILNLKCSELEQAELIINR